MQSPLLRTRVSPNIRKIALNTIMLRPGYCNQPGEILRVQGGHRQSALGRILDLVAEEVAAARWREALCLPRHCSRHHHHQDDSPSVFLAILSLEVLLHLLVQQ